MAKVDIQMPNDFIMKISELHGKADEIAERVLQAGGEVVLDRVQSALEAVVGKDTKYESRSTGELARSLGLSDVKMDRDGKHNIKVGFSEPRSDGESNAKLATILEYGKHGQPAKPFLKRAKSASRAECIATMRRTYEEEVSKL